MLRTWRFHLTFHTAGNTWIVPGWPGAQAQTGYLLLVTTGNCGNKSFWFISRPVILLEASAFLKIFKEANFNSFTAPSSPMLMDGLLQTRVSFSCPSEENFLITLRRLEKGLLFLCSVSLPSPQRSGPTRAVSVPLGEPVGASHHGSLQHSELRP